MSIRSSVVHNSSTYNRHTGYKFAAVKRHTQADTSFAVRTAGRFDEEILDGALPDVETVVVEHDLLDVSLVEGTVDLRAGALHCRPLSAIQDLKMERHEIRSRDSRLTWDLSEN